MQQPAVLSADVAEASLVEGRPALGRLVMAGLDQPGVEDVVDPLGVARSVPSAAAAGQRRPTVRAGRPDPVPPPRPRPGSVAAGRRGGPRPGPPAGNHARGAAPRPGRDRAGDGQRTAPRRRVAKIEATPFSSLLRFLPRTRSELYAFIALILVIVNTLHAFLPSEPAQLTPTQVEQIVQRVVDHMNHDK